MIKSVKQISPLSHPTQLKQHSSIYFKLNLSEGSFAGTYDYV